MNRASRRQLARKGGWHGSSARARKGGPVSFADAMRRGVEEQVSQAQIDLEPSPALKEMQARRDAEAMGLWLPE